MYPYQLPRLASDGAYGVRKRSFRPTLKLTLQHSKRVGARPPSPTAWERGAYGVRKRSFRPTLKLTLQHSKRVGARPPSPTLWERGWG